MAAQNVYVLQQLRRAVLHPAVMPSLAKLAALAKHDEPVLPLVQPASAGATCGC